MTRLFIAFTFLAAPALAHNGAHIHPHADDPSWIPVIFGTLAVTLAAAFFWRRK